MMSDAEIGSPPAGGLVVVLGGPAGSFLLLLGFLGPAFPRFSRRRGLDVSSRVERAAQWPVCDRVVRRFLFHPTRRPGSASYQHVAGVCVFFGVSGQLHHQSRAAW